MRGCSDEPAPGAAAEVFCEEAISILNPVFKYKKAIVLFGSYCCVGVQEFVECLSSS